MSMAMTKREQLVTFADRFLKLINTPGADLNGLDQLIAHDLNTPLCYPGTPSGYEGIKALLQKLHGSLTSWALTVEASVVDDQQSSVVYFVKSAGVQTGYPSKAAINTSEWHGVPGTGKSFDHFGFLMMKVHAT
jgi:hypothetical protein